MEQDKRTEPSTDATDKPHRGLAVAHTLKNTARVIFTVLTLPLRVDPRSPEEMERQEQLYRENLLP